jgi:hypothetical protein
MCDPTFDGYELDGWIHVCLLGEGYRRTAQGLIFQVCSMREYSDVRPYGAPYSNFCLMTIPDHIMFSYAYGLATPSGSTMRTKMLA